MFKHKTFPDGSEWTPKHGVAALTLAAVGSVVLYGATQGTGRLIQKMKDRRQFKKEHPYTDEPR